MEDLSSVAAQLVDNPDFMAYWLHRLAASGVDVVAALDAAPVQISWLAVCRAPRRDGRWSSDVRSIAGATGIDAGRLVKLLSRDLPGRAPRQ